MSRFENKTVMITGGGKNISKAGALEVGQYRVMINGEPVKLESICVSAHPFNRVWPGKQRDISQGEQAYMLRLYGEGEVTVSVQTENTVKQAVVRPLSQGVQPLIDGTSVSFTLPGNGKYSVEINGVHHAIHLFYVKPADFPERETATYRFGAGHHDVGLLTLKSGESVYIDRDAVVHGSIAAVDVENVHIFGHGVLDGGWEIRTERHGDLGWDGESRFSPELIHTYGGIRMFRCGNIRIEGITVIDPASYAVSFFGCEGIEIDNVNVVGLWRYNTDGIDFFNSSHIRVTDCFIRSFDDSMCMKGLTAFSDRSVTDVRVTNCVFWCDWGKNVDIGLATACPEIAHVTWEDCDFIHGSGSVITISNGQWADIHDITYRNLRVEYSADTERPVLQERDEDVYSWDGVPIVPALVSISDVRRNWQGNISYDDARTKIRDVTIENIAVSMEQGIAGRPRVSVQRLTESSTFGNIRIRGIYVNGEPMEAEGWL